MLTQAFPLLKSPLQLGSVYLQYQWFHLHTFMPFEQLTVSFLLFFYFIFIADIIAAVPLCPSSAHLHPAPISLPSGHHHTVVCVYWGGTKKTQSIYKKLCILTCLNFSHLQSTLYLMQFTYQDVFSTAQNSFWTRWFWCLLVLVSFLVLCLPHQQNVSLWGLVSSRETKKRLLWLRLGE